jgi:predicted nucleotidyltransferase
VSSDEQRTLVERTTILRGTVGSTVHGLHQGDQDDRDEMAIFLEPPQFLVGLQLVKSGNSWGSFEHYVQRTQPEGARSGPGDLDLVAYSLRKWLRLAVSGNPTVLLLLFSPSDSLVVCTERGAKLRELAPAIVSRKAGPRFVGYMRAQKERLVGTRGQRRVNRPELIDAHGFDTKYAMHVARLGLQGIELLTTGHLTLPMAEPERSRVMSIRRGDVPLDEAIVEIEEIERRLEAAVEDSSLRDEPDYERVDGFLIDSYREAWGWH